MKVKAVPLFPILAASFPVVSVFGNNSALIPASDMVRPLVFAIAGVAAVWVLGSLILRSWVKGGFLSVVAYILFFTYLPVRTVIDPFEATVVEPLVLLVTGFGLSKIRRSLTSLVTPLNFGGLALVVLPLMMAGSKSAEGPRPAFLDVKLPSEIKPATARPDIYFVIVDGYGRADQLKRVMSLDNSDFIRSLRTRGFFVADRASSNYSQTQLSLASTLNLSYLQDYPQLFQSKSEDRAPLTYAIQRSALANFLKRHGYSTVSVTSGFDQVSFSTDVSFSAPTSYTMLELALLQLTPLRQSALIGSAFEGRRQLLRGAFANLAYASKLARPKFVIAHIIAPHPSFVFDAAGNPVRQSGVMPSFSDGSDFMSFGGSREKYIEGYTGQLKWVNSQLDEMLNKIVPKRGQQPIVVIAGDHGSKLGLDQALIEKTDLAECMSNLIAIYAPEQVKAKLYPEISSVNIFRAILSGVFDDRIELLPDRSYYSPFNLPYRFTNVADRVK